MRTWLVCGALLVARAALAQPAPDAEPAPPPAGPPPAAVAPPSAMPPVAIAAAPLAHTHHGVFFRVLLGPGAFRTSTTIGTDAYEISGGGGGISLAVGGAVTPQLVVYGEVFDDIAQSPTVTTNGQAAPSSSNVNAGVVGFGPGIAYYFPSNFYIGGTLAASRITVQQNNQEVAHSGTGLGISAHLGKEWWVSDSWGIGIALQVYGGSIPDGQANVSWKTGAGMLAFSATYN